MVTGARLAGLSHLTSRVTDAACVRWSDFTGSSIPGSSLLCCDPLHLKMHSKKEWTGTDKSPRWKILAKIQPVNFVECSVE